MKVKVWNETNPVLSQNRHLSLFYQFDWSLVWLKMSFYYSFNFLCFISDLISRRTLKHILQNVLLSEIYNIYIIFTLSNDFVRLWERKKEKNKGKTESKIHYLCFSIFYNMTLIENHVIPLNLREEINLISYYVIRCYYQVVVWEELP